MELGRSIDLRSIGLYWPLAAFFFFWEADVARLLVDGRVPPQVSENYAMFVLNCSTVQLLMVAVHQLFDELTQAFFGEND